MSTSEAAIRAKLTDYLDGKITIDDFETWFVPSTWDLDPMEDRDLSALSAKIHLRLAEFDNGNWTESELKEFLRNSAITMAIHC